MRECLRLGGASGGHLISLCSSRATWSRLPITVSTNSCSEMNWLMGDIPLQSQKVDHSPPRKTLKGKVSVGAVGSALAHVALAGTAPRIRSGRFPGNGADSGALMGCACFWMQKQSNTLIWEMNPWKQKSSSWAMVLPCCWGFLLVFVPCAVGKGSNAGVSVQALPPTSELGHESAASGLASLQCC